MIALWLWALLWPAAFAVLWRRQTRLDAANIAHVMAEGDTMTEYEPTHGAMTAREWRIMAVLAEVAPIAVCPACGWGLTARTVGWQPPPCSACEGVSRRLDALGREVMPAPVQVLNIIEGRRSGMRAASQMIDRARRIEQRERQRLPVKP